MILKEILDTMPTQPYVTTPTDVFQQFLGAIIEVNHTDLGKIIGTVLEVNNTGDLDTSWIKMQYYKPDNTLAISYFSPIDLSAPQYYTGPIPPYQPQPRPFPNIPWWWYR